MRKRYQPETYQFVSDRRYTSEEIGNISGHDVIQNPYRSGVSTLTDDFSQYDFWGENDSYYLVRVDGVDIDRRVMP